MQSIVTIVPRQAKAVAPDADLFSGHFAQDDWEFELDQMTGLDDIRQHLSGAPESSSLAAMMKLGAYCLDFNLRTVDHGCQPGEHCLSCDCRATKKKAA